MRIKNNFILSFFFFSTIVFNAINLTAQTYGLKFKGMGESLDNRTELNLTPEDSFTFENEFEISFYYKTTLLYKNDYRGLFGYIFRIVNDENHNVDLISSITDESIDLNIVTGKNESIIRSNYPATSINRWVKIRVKFNLLEDRLIFYTEDTFYVMNEVGFKKKDHFKLIFGINDYLQFKTSDVPTMQIKDLKILEEGKLKYHWPLNEIEGNIAIDLVDQRKAEVRNPVWLSYYHQIWQPLFENERKGEMIISSDNINKKIFLLGEKELLIYDIESGNSKTIAFEDRPNFNLNDYKGVYNHQERKIYCYLMNGGPVYSLNVDSGIWGNIDAETNLSSEFRHHNRYYHPADNSLYLFGGYGQHIYHNRIKRLDFNNDSFTDLPTDSLIFHPKYLAGLGALNDTIYILGGYGSKSGNQLINPQSYYDLFGYSINDNTLFKKFDISKIIDDMCVANSMFIDESNRDYYALIFEKSKFNGDLQLIRGNLDSPNVDVVGNEIDFQFLDVRTNSGLFNMIPQEKLLAYTTYFTDSSTTKVQIFSINYPPSNFIEKESELKQSNGLFNPYLILGIASLLSIPLLLLLKRRKNKTLLKSTIKTEDNTIEAPKVKPRESFNTETNYRFMVFGGFQVFNSKSEDITGQFTPLLKELFLLIWLHTFKNNKGISSEKLTEILWYDKSEKSAQNNRAVNLAKLRHLLEQIGSIRLSKKTGYWKAIYNESLIKSDHIDFLNLTSSKSNLTKEKINHLIDITDQGPFLRNVQYPWLDDFKAKISELTIDTLIHFANQCDIKNEAEFIIHLADSIFIFDVTNEDAMILKCKALHFAGKHSYAKATYEKFYKEYAEMYGEEYKRSFINILKDDA